MDTAAPGAEALSARPQPYRHGNSDILPAWAQREAAAAEQPWTATRCHRQLRPLLAHLTALRRETALGAFKEQKDAASDQAPRSSKQPHPDDDLASRKRVRYTYSLKGTGRRQRQDRQPSTTGMADGQLGEGLRQPERTRATPLKQHTGRSVCPGEVVVATPVLSRAWRQRHAWSLPSSPITQHALAAAPATSADGCAPTMPAEAARPKAAHPAIATNPHFKYRGYYQGLSRPGGSGSGSAKSPVDEEWAVLSNATPAAFCPLYESILRAVDALLRATAGAPDGPAPAAPSAPPAARPNSLLAMCLRKVPHYVAACEAAEREEALRNGTAACDLSDVSFAIYSDLEALGTEGGGWRHLQTVVRAHGISILEAACAEGLLHDAFVRLLIRLCMSRRAYQEAEVLIAALFALHVSSCPKGQHLYGLPEEAEDRPGASAGPVASLSLLVHYADESGRTSAPLAQVTQLLDSGHLPVAWLSSQSFRGLWHRVVRLLSSRGAAVCDGGLLVDFATAAVTRLVQPRPADDRPNLCAGPAASLSSSTSYHTLVSILGSICAVGLLQQEAALDNSEGGGVPEPLVLRRLSAIMERSLLATRPQRKPRKQNANHGGACAVPLRRYLLAQALRLLAVNREQGRPSDQGEGDARARRHESRSLDMGLPSHMAGSAGPAQSEALYDVTVAIVTSVAENCGRGARSASLGGAPAARGYLLKLCAHMCSSLGQLSDCESEASLLGRLQADAAFLLASRSNDLRDLAFAESLRRGLAQTGSLPPPAPVPAMPTAARPAPSHGRHAGPPAGLFEGYRWEEGISEWVVSTPRRKAGHTRQGGTGMRRHSDAIVAQHGLRATAADDGEEGARRGPVLRRGRGRRSLPVSSSNPTPSPAPRDATTSTGGGSDSDGGTRSDNDSDVASPSLPRMPRRRAAPARNKTRSSRRPLRSLRPFLGDAPRTADSDSDWEPEATSRKRAKRGARPGMGMGAPSTRTSLLDLVSDNADEAADSDADGENDGTSGMGGSKGARPAPVTRTPLRRMDGNATRLARPGLRCQDKRASAGGRGQAMCHATSDDELCL